MERGWLLERWTDVDSKANIYCKISLSGQGNNFLACTVFVSGKPFQEYDWIIHFVQQGKERQRKDERLGVATVRVALWFGVLPRSRENGKALLAQSTAGKFESQGSKCGYLGEQLVPRNGSSKAEESLLEGTLLIPRVSCWGLVWVLDLPVITPPLKICHLQAESS